MVGTLAVILIVFTRIYRSSGDGGGKDGGSAAGGSRRVAARSGTAEAGGGGGGGQMIRQGGVGEKGNVLGAEKLQYRRRQAVGTAGGTGYRVKTQRGEGERGDISDRWIQLRQQQRGHQSANEGVQGQSSRVMGPRGYGGMATVQRSGRRRNSTARRYTWSPPPGINNNNNLPVAGAAAGGGGQVGNTGTIGVTPSNSLTWRNLKRRWQPTSGDQSVSSGAVRQRQFQQRQSLSQSVESGATGGRDGQRRAGGYEQFAPRLKLAERRTLMRTLAALTKALDAANVTYWMDSGTLLGSYRHHGLIPWDDDVDLLVRASDRATARRAIDSLGPDYGLYVEMTSSPNNATTLAGWRFYPTHDSQPVSGATYRFPLVDLQFYAENSTHVWSELVNWWPYMVWPKEKFLFPLYRRPFGNLNLTAPCKTLSYLQTEFDSAVDEMCVSPKSDSTGHRSVRPVGVRSVTVPCRDLQTKSIFRFPLVIRTKEDTKTAAGGRGGGGGRGESVVETLMLRGRAVRRLIVDTGNC